MRSTPAARSTFVFTTSAAATSLLSTTMAFAGHVPIGATDVVLEGDLSDTQALVGQLLGEKHAPFVIEDFVTGQTLLAGTIEQRMIMEAEKCSITFHYLITNTPSSEGTGELYRFSAFSFGEWVQTDVNYLIDDAAAGKPSRIGRSDNVVDASFDNPDGLLHEGDAISFFVRTNATIYDETGFVVADALSPVAHETSGNIRSTVVDGLYRAVVLEGPIAIPLPAALYSGLVGLFTVAWAKRRVKRRMKSEG
ncbi:MAG: hypothetical protein WBD40_09775 [Tepidisphaeraceae bacterium]